MSREEILQWKVREFNHMIFMPNRSVYLPCINRTGEVAVVHLCEAKEGDGAVGSNPRLRRGLVPKTSALDRSARYRSLPDISSKNKIELISFEEN
ncbi:hypothetical protein HNY73_012181 [Argiope bruennichi]|uniref:Uncharacterized protein n=1 Tax=Argiope bruennichi TaxID=94029 RepID=A0A8T0EW63_ARGBR|nr:hypothetical protein HNY73_012181 [Argiope bruennichi]